MSKPTESETELYKQAKTFIAALGIDFCLNQRVPAHLPTAIRIFNNLKFSAPTFDTINLFYFLLEL
jgi:hypothetical protein